MSSNTRYSNFSAHLRKIVIGLGLVLLAGPTLAQGASSFPSRPVTVMVPYPPGQAADLLARLMATELAKVWGQSVVVDNRGGGASIPGTMAGRNAAADGYTITWGATGPIGVNPSLYPKLPYDPLADFAMVGGVFYTPMIFVAGAGAPYKNLADLVNAAKNNPGKLQIAYAGIGTAQHLTSELFKARAGLEIEGVSYKGSGPAMTDLLGGHIQLLSDSTTAVLPYVQQGKITALAVTSPQRMPQLPNVPTVAELGYPGFSGVGWGGFMVPKNTPADIVEKIGTDVRRILADPAMQQRIIDRGGVADPRGSKEWTEFVRSEISKWGEIVRKTNLKVD